MYRLGILCHIFALSGSSALAAPPTIKQLQRTGPALTVDASWQIEASSGATGIATLLMDGTLTFDCRDDFPALSSSPLSSFTVPERVLMIDVKDTVASDRAALAAQLGFSVSWFDTLLVTPQAYVVVVSSTNQQIAIIGGSAAGLQYGVVDLLKSSEVYTVTGERSCQQIGRDSRAISSAASAIVAPVKVLNYPDVETRISSQRLLHFAMRESYCSLTTGNVSASTWFDECVFTGDSITTGLQSNIIAAQFDQAVWNQYNVISDVDGGPYLHSYKSVDPAIPQAADRYAAILAYLAERHISYIPTLFPLSPNTDGDLYGEDWSGSGYSSPGAAGDVSLSEGLGATVEAYATSYDGSTYYVPPGYTLTSSGGDVVLVPTPTVALKNFEDRRGICADDADDQPVAGVYTTGEWFALSESHGATCDTMKKWTIRDIDGDTKLCGIAESESLLLRLTHYNESTTPYLFESGGLYALGLELSGDGTLLLTQNIWDSKGETDLSGAPAGQYPTRLETMWSGDTLTPADPAGAYESFVFRVPGGDFAEDADQPGARPVHTWLELRATSSEEICIDDVQIIPVSGQLRNVEALTLTASSGGNDYSADIDYIPTAPQAWSDYFDPDYDPSLDALLDGITGTLTAPEWVGSGPAPAAMTLRYTSQTASGSLSSGAKSFPYTPAPAVDASGVLTALTSIGYGITYSPPFLEFGAADEVRGVNRAWTEQLSGSGGLMSNAEWLAEVINAMDDDSCASLGTCGGRTTLRPLLWADMFGQYNNGGNPLYQLPYSGRVGETWPARSGIAADAVLSVWVYGDAGTPVVPQVGMEKIMLEVDDLSSAGFDLIGTPWCEPGNARHWAAVATSPNYTNLLGLRSPEWGDFTVNYEEMDQIKGMVADASWNARVSLLDFWYVSDQADWPGGVELSGPLIEAYDSEGFSPAGMPIGGAMSLAPAEHFSLTSPAFSGPEFLEVIELRFYTKSQDPAFEGELLVTLRALDGGGALLAETPHVLTAPPDLAALAVELSSPPGVSSFEIEIEASTHNAVDVLLDSIALYQVRASVDYPTYAGGLSYLPEMSIDWTWDVCDIGG